MNRCIWCKNRFKGCGVFPKLSTTICYFKASKRHWCCTILQTGVPYHVDRHHHSAINQFTAFARKVSAPAGYACTVAKICSVVAAFTSIHGCPLGLKTDGNPRTQPPACWHKAAFHTTVTSPLPSYFSAVFGSIGFKLIRLPILYSSS